MNNLISPYDNKTTKQNKNLTKLISRYSEQLRESFAENIGLHRLYFLAKFVDKFRHQGTGLQLEVKHL